MSVVFPFLQIKGTPFKPTRTLPGTEYLFLAMIAIIAVAVLVWAIWSIWRWRMQVRRRWEELRVLSQRAGLSREEHAFLRRMLRRGRIKNPMTVMENEHTYVSFFEREPRWPTHRSELLVQSIQRKIFGTSPESERMK